MDLNINSEEFVPSQQIYNEARGIYRMLEEKLTYKDILCKFIEDDKNNKTHLKKTEICHLWKETGFCKFGENCGFAHGEIEIKEKKVHQKHKSELCKSFHENIYCPYGERCSFVHLKNDNFSFSEIYSINSENFVIFSNRLQIFEKITKI
jgi:hypothetical protein